MKSFPGATSKEVLYYLDPTLNDVTQQSYM